MATIQPNARLKEPEHKPGEPVTEDMAKQIFRVRTLRRMLEKGWNQSELGRRSGVSRDMISTYLRDPPRSLPMSDNLIKIAAALGVPTETLMPSQGEVKATQPLETIGSDDAGFWVKVNIALPFEAYADLTALVQKVLSGGYGGGAGG